MLKITKGLKKKKKGKKSKNKEDDLFDSAELEQYRREQQQKQETGTAETSEAGDSEKGEEWEKFKALTSGVDDILKKTQGDLDRIKSTSYFQKKPPGSSGTSNVKTEVVKTEVQPTKGKWVGFEDSVTQEDDEGEDKDKVEVTQTTSNQQEVEEAEEEEESELEDEQDDIFDTSYVDVVASGEVKLAYVPDSPVKEDDSFDPFDTSIVDTVIKTDPKKRNLVSLGCAVEVLTGKLEKSTGAADSVPTQRRRPKPQDLLLDSFDESDIQPKVDAEPEPIPKSILDDDPVFAEETSAILEFPPVTPSFERKSLCTPLEDKPKNKEVDIKDLVEEFIPGNLDDKFQQVVVPEPDDELDDEFAALAAESLAKTQPIVTNKPPKPPRPELPTVVAAVEDEVEDIDEFVTGDDPFDTSFAAQVLPGKFELKLIEKEILLDNDNEVKINPSLQLQNLIENSKVRSVAASNFIVSANELCDQEPLSLKHRDLLGGSTTDLSKISQSPIVPQTFETSTKELTNDDPFDTSIINDLVAPGKTELKFLEKELLTEVKSVVEVDIDNDFNPRAEEKLNNKPISRPDNLIVNNKRVSVPKIVAFDLKSPSNLPDLLAVGLEDSAKVSKPLTPYYPPNNVSDKSEFEIDADPFDTSFVTNYPGKLELKLIEQELTSAKEDLKRSLSDEDFNPRAETEDNQLKQFPTISTDYRSPEQPDIISEEVKIEAKLHTPVTPRKITEVFEESVDFDPFDTSIANVLAPGKAEIKILETELIYAKENPPIQPINTIITETLTSKLVDTKPLTDFLEQPAEEITVKPLTPVVASSLDREDIDPFDTSCVGTILPGKTEIKLLESELLN